MPWTLSFTKKLKIKLNCIIPINPRLLYGALSHSNESVKRKDGKASLIPL